MNQPAFNLNDSKVAAASRGLGPELPARLGNAMNNDKVQLCPDCHAPMRRDVRTVTWTFRGLPLTYDQPAWWCSGDPGHEYVMTREDMVVTDPPLKAHRTRALAPATPDEVRAIREWLHVSKRGAGEVLGAGANAFQKYEDGDVKPSQGMTLLLRILKLHPELWPQIAGQVRHEPAASKRGQDPPATDGGGGEPGMRPDATLELRP